MKFYFLLTLIMLYSSCKKEEIKVKPSYINEKGLVPLVIEIDSPLGLIEINFIYKNNVLLSKQGYDYFYNNDGYVSKITSDAYNYVDFFYECGPKVTKVVSHNKAWNNDTVKITGSYTFNYTDGLITEVYNSVKNTQRVISYTDDLKNKASIENYDEYGDLVDKTFYEYDTLKNPSINDYTPTFDFVYSGYNNQNNVIHTIRYKYKPTLDTFEFFREIEYGLYGYPKVIKFIGSSFLRKDTYVYTKFH